MEREELLKSIQVIAESVTVFPDDVSEEYKRGYLNGLEDARRAIICNYDLLEEIEKQHRVA